MIKLQVTKDYLIKIRINLKRLMYVDNNNLKYK